MSREGRQADLVSTASAAKDARAPTRSRRWSPRCTDLLWPTLSRTTRQVRSLVAIRAAHHDDFQVWLTQQHPGHVPGDIAEPRRPSLGFRGSAGKESGVRIPIARWRGYGNTAGLRGRDGARIGRYLGTVVMMQGGTPPPQVLCASASGRTDLERPTGQAYPVGQGGEDSTPAFRRGSVAPDESPTTVARRSRAFIA